MILQTCAALIAVCLASAASAQTVYRCGNVYQDKPCPGATIVDAEPNKGMEVRSPNGSVVHSPSGDKGRNARTMEQMHENIRTAIACAGDAPTVTNNRIDCPSVKAQRDAKRVTPDYIRK